MKFAKYLLLSLFLTSCSIIRQTSPQIEERDIYRHLSYIASDKLEGRRAGTKGEELARIYIAENFKRFGLKPAGDNGTYFQWFDYTYDVKLGENNSVVFEVADKKISLQLNRDFIPLVFSENGGVEGELVFAGYGISAEDLNYDDYSGIDVKGKIVIVLKGLPDGYRPHSEFEKYLSLRYRVSNAQSKGASGVIFVDPFSEKFEKFQYDHSVGRAGIPAVDMRNKFLDSLFALLNFDFKTYDIVKKIYDTRKPNSFALNCRVSLQTDVRYLKTKIANVIGYLESSNPKYKDEFIIIGAHFDHLGWGGQGSLIPDTVAIHNGADDNGSGTAGLLELAEYLSHNRKNLNRSILFIAFTAEEEGTIGSAYYVKNPIFPLENTIAMINMDMIGRLRDKLTIYGVGTSPIWNEIIEKVNSDFKFDLNLIKDGYGPSDHAQFYMKNIPVLHFFTGIHSDYHKPSDDYDRINYERQRKVLEFISKVVFELDKVREKPQFVKVETPTQRSSRGFRVTLGVVPDYSEDTQGMRISDVRPGSPAEKAGLKAGDVIIKMGNLEIKNIYDYTYALGDFKPGDEVEVVVLRGGEKMSFKVKFEERK